MDPPGATSAWRVPLVWEHLEQVERRELLRQVVEKLEVERAVKQETEVGTLVRLKVHFLPEQEIIIPPQKRVRDKKTCTGVARLTPPQLAVLYWMAQGKQIKEVADILVIPVSNIRTYMSQIRRIMGIKDINEIARLAAGQVQANPEIAGGRFAQSPGDGTGGITGGRSSISEIDAGVPTLRQRCTTKGNREAHGPVGVNGQNTARSNLGNAKATTIYEAVQKAKVHGWL